MAKSSGRNAANGPLARKSGPGGADGASSVGPGSLASVFPSPDGVVTGDIPRAAVKILLIVCFLVCPLLFFTDLTRNPYFTQIALLNMALLGAVALYAIDSLRKQSWAFPRTPLDIPLACWVIVCAFAWTYSYFHHTAYYRDSMRSEGMRVFTFTIVNTLIPYYLAAAWSRETLDEGNVSLTPWAIFAVVWGFLWTLFPSMHSVGGPPLEFWNHIWDSYGALVWIIGICAAAYFSWRSNPHDYWHLALTVGFLSSIYGIAQYFNTEFIWPKVLNPYGGRAVSTFGNPNFLSSYLVLLLPIVVAYYLQAMTVGARIVYAVVFLAMEACLVSSLTRSSWAGALVGLLLLFFSKDLRARAKQNLEMHGLVVGLAVVMIFLWPQSTVTGYTPSVLGRVKELSSALNVRTTSPYSPLYQRVLIWSCAWLMGKSNPISGNGWGLFELFYPFYQGHMLVHFDFFHTMRTHANNAHNEVLEVWAQTGILGVGILFWIWITFFTSAAKWCREAEREAVWIIAPLAGIAGMLVDNLLNVSLHFAVPAFLFWWQSGYVMGRGSAVEKRWRMIRFPKRGLAIAASLLLTLGCMRGAWSWVEQWNREVRYFMGFKLMRGGGLSAATNMLESAYRWDSHEVNTNYELGNAYARSGIFPKAIWAYEQAIKANAGYDEIYFNLGTVLFQKLNRPKDAVNYYLLSFIINPLSIELYVNLSALYLQDAQLYKEQAIELLEHAVHIYPEQPNFFNNLGYFYSLVRDYPKAEAMWTRALQLDPDQVYPVRNLQAMAQQTGRPTPPIIAELAGLRDLEARITKQDYSESTLILARKVAAQFPQSMKAKFYQGNLELIHGHPEAALPLLEPLRQIQPNNVSLEQNLAEIYLRLGRRSDAIRTLQFILQIEPGNAYARSRLAQIGSGG